MSAHSQNIIKRRGRLEVTTDSSFSLPDSGSSSSRNPAFCPNPAKIWLWPKFGRISARYANCHADWQNALCLLVISRDNVSLFTRSRTAVCTQRYTVCLKSEVHSLHYQNSHTVASRYETQQNIVHQTTIVTAVTNPPPAPVGFANTNPAGFRNLESGTALLVTQLGHAVL